MATSKKHERVCVCGQKYKYCNSCSEYSHMEPWHLRWCSTNCMEIDKVLTNWGAKIIDSMTASELLKGLDLSRIEFWNDNFKAAYNQIMKESSSTKEEKPVEKPVVEAKPQKTASQKKADNLEATIKKAQEITKKPTKQNDNSEKKAD